MADDWCPENDGAYRAEMAALNRDNVDQQLLRARAENARLRAALQKISAGEGYYGEQAREYKDIARAALAQKGTNHDR